jgi:hypothetical protein
MELFMILLCVAIFVFALVLGLICSEVCNTNITKKRNALSVSPRPVDEHFLLTPQGAKIDPTTGALKGVGLITDGLLTTNWKDIEKSVAEKGVGFDGKRIIGVGATEDGLDKAYRNYQEVLELDNNAGYGVRDPEDSRAISKKLAMSNNAQNNLYTRGGGYPTKMILAPHEIRGVIDERYVPERDKNRQLAVVSTVIHVPGFEINPERLGVNLMDTHFSNVSRNNVGRRIPSAAGAIGTNVNKEVNSGDDSTESPNRLALEDRIKVNGDNLLFKRDAPGGQNAEIIAAPIESTDINEGYSNKYALNNYRIKKK